MTEPANDDPATHRKSPGNPTSGRRSRRIDVARASRPHPGGTGFQPVNVASPLRRGAGFFRQTQSPVDVASRRRHDSTGLASEARERDMYPSSRDGLRKRSPCKRQVLLLLSGLSLLFATPAPAFAVPLPATDPLTAARALLDTERLPEAREPLETLLATDPRNAEARLLLGRVYIGLGRHADAIATLAPALRVTPDTTPLAPRLHAEYGRACLLQADEPGIGLRALPLARRGRDALEKASALAPDNITYHEGLEEYYRRAPGIAGGSSRKAKAHAQAITRLKTMRDQRHETTTTTTTKITTTTTITTTPSTAESTAEKQSREAPRPAPAQP